MRRRSATFTALLLASAVPAAAQEHDHAAMGHAAPEAEAEAESEPEMMDHSAMDHSAMGHSAPEAETDPDPEAMDHSAMDHSAMGHGDADEPAPMDHSAMGHAMPAPATNAAPPARAFEGPRHAADAIWGEQAMRPTRVILGRENGGFRTGSVMIERLEARLADGADGFVWEGQAFWGGDINRFVVKSEGEGALSNGDVDDAEVQTLWSRAIGPFTDLQAGVRVDLAPDTRAHAVLGVQGASRWWIHYDGALFLSDTGDLTARIEAEYDQRITQRLILQPRAEVNFAAQDIPERGVGAGVSDFELGLRLRYEFVREFAPYVGVDWERRVGGSADYARAAGDKPGSFAVLIGLRSWF